MNATAEKQNTHRNTPPFLDCRIVFSGETEEQEPKQSIAGEQSAHSCSQTAERRGELKYVLDEDTYRAFIEATGTYLEPDSYALSHISSLYLDTQNSSIIRRSLEKPSYKEKLRIRTYVDNPTLEDICFLEIKRKFKGTVYKRRVKMTLKEAFAFCQTRKYPAQTLESLSEIERQIAVQILHEIDWMFSQYGRLEPSFMVSCKRLSLKECDTDSLRITFDSDLRWSHKYGWDLPGQGAHALINPESRIMEIKSTKGMPFWLVDTLNDLEIYPQSFSKVGKSFQRWASRRIEEEKGKRTRLSEACRTRV